MKSEIAEKILHQTPEEVRFFVRQYTDIAVRINEILDAKGYTQDELSTNFDPDTSEVGRWLKGNHNITLDTLLNLEAELGEPIVFAVSNTF